MTSAYIMLEGHRDQAVVADRRSPHLGTSALGEMIYRPLEYEMKCVILLSRCIVGSMLTRDENACLTIKPDD